MKKIGIITLTRNPNYGNVLQNVAMQKIIKELGYVPETIINMNNTSLFKGKRGVKNKIKVLINRNHAGTEERRRKNFLSCCKQYVKYAKGIYIGNTSKFNQEDYYCFIVGSDQVWNPYFGFATDFEFLQFTDENKRISYSASFGVSDISNLDEEKMKVIKNGIEKMHSLSVRERSGQNIVSKFTNRKSEVHIDPTMLLSATEWEVLAKKPRKKMPAKYVLIYMLGSVTEEYQNAISDLKIEYSAEVINILDNTFRTLDPLEFIWMIKNSECICTDSFHATVFSILFHKKFFIFNRVDEHENQNDRFVTLLDMCGIEYTIGEIKYRKEPSWNKVDALINAERERSMHYLENELARV